MRKLKLIFTLALISMTIGCKDNRDDIVRLRWNETKAQSKKVLTMDIKSQAKGMELIYASLPYPKQINNIDLSKKDRVYFYWRKVKYRLQLNGGRVDKIDGELEIGDDCSILITELIRSKYCLTF